MKIIFMGTPDFAVGTLDAIYKAGHNIELVITQPDRPYGRKGKLKKCDVKLRAEELGLLVISPEKIRKDEEAKKVIRDINPDLIVVTAFGQILPKDILEIPKYGCINVHASLLPKYRGAAPIQWSIINGDEYTGVTTMQMDEGLDTGDILVQKKLKIDEKETGGSLFDKLSVLGGELIVETIDRLIKGDIVAIKQDNEKATKVGLFKKDEGLIDWNMDAIVIERLIRGLSPWPSAFTFLRGESLKIWEADIIENLPEGVQNVAILGDLLKSKEEFKESSENGSLYLGKRELFVKCGKAYLSLKSIQLSGKKRMNVKDFLNGYHF